jgi:hypothetical protein
MIHSCAIFAKIAALVGTQGHLVFLDMMLNIVHSEEINLAAPMAPEQQHISYFIVSYFTKKAH